MMLSRLSPPQFRRLPGRPRLALALAGAAIALAGCTAQRVDQTAEADGVPAAAVTTAALTAVVYKDRYCGCCNDWVDHIREAGFAVTAHDVTDLNAVKRRHAIPGRLHSCHTAEIGGYVVEGHVPADVIHRLLRERPRVAGIAVPGMPMGSPGMEGPYSEPYEIIAFSRSGESSVYDRR